MTSIYPEDEFVHEPPVEQAPWINDGYPYVDAPVTIDIIVEDAALESEAEVARASQLGAVSLR